MFFICYTTDEDGCVAIETLGTFKSELLIPEIRLNPKQHNDTVMLQYDKYDAVTIKNTVMCPHYGTLNPKKDNK